MSVTTLSVFVIKYSDKKQTREKVFILSYIKTRNWLEEAAVFAVTRQRSRDAVVSSSFLFSLGAEPREQSHRFSVACQLSLSTY